MGEPSNETVEVGGVVIRVSDISAVSVVRHVSRNNFIWGWLSALVGGIVAAMAWMEKPHIIPLFIVGWFSLIIGLFKANVRRWWVLVQTEDGRKFEECFFMLRHQAERERDRIQEMTSRFTPSRPT